MTHHTSATIKSYLFPMIGVVLTPFLIFSPYGDPSITECFISVFTSAFLHGSQSHLFGNMIVLWVAGNALEPRLGPFKYSIGYLFCIITTKVFVLIMLFIKADKFDGFDVLDFHSLGASGAISGLIGIFAVRCFFARVSVGLPIFFLPLFSMPVKINATILIGLFFAIQLSGSEAQFYNHYGNINYWAHVGGYMGGFLLASLLNQNAKSAKEYTKVTAKKNGKQEFGHKNAKTAYKEILKRDPEDEQALQYLLSKSMYNKLSAEKYYSKLIVILSRKDIKKAMVLFYTYFPNYTRVIDGMSLTRICIQCYKAFDLHAASTCLEFAAEKQGPWQSKALFQLGILFEESGNDILAANYFKKLIEQSDDSQFKKEAQKRLKI